MSFGKFLTFHAATYRALDEWISKKLAEILQIPHYLKNLQSIVTYFFCSFIPFILIEYEIQKIEPFLPSHTISNFYAKFKIELNSVALSNFGTSLAPLMRDILNIHVNGVTKHYSKFQNFSSNITIFNTI